MASIKRVRFHYLTSSFFFKNRKLLKAFILNLVKKNGRTTESINYIFCSDEYLLSLNQNYLSHNTYTDIITFELSPSASPIIADIFISIERVKENATTFGQSFNLELHRVIFHGTLHLCGYNDKNKRQASVMRKQEESCLHNYFTTKS